MYGEATSPDNHMYTIDRRLNIMPSGGTSSNKATLDESASAKELKSDSPLFLDELQGNAIHCNAWSNIAHNFIKLKEGIIYCIKNFVVHPNKEEYRIRKDDAFMIKFNGATSARKSLAKAARFVKHPFQLVELDSVELTDKKYMIDVAGYVTNVGRSIQQRISSRTIDFYLANERGQMLRVTLCRGEYVAFICQVQIDDIRTRNGWHFPMCGEEKCKKGVGRKQGGWWCDACDKAVEYPVLRYRLELGIFDASVHVVVVMFDETASKLVKCSADSLAQCNTPKMGRSGIWSPGRVTS
nr:hypothetical protein [Tanacetum cinerariifolium]